MTYKKRNAGYKRKEMTSAQAILWGYGCACLPNERKTRREPVLHWLSDPFESLSPDTKTKMYSL